MNKCQHQLSLIEKAFASQGGGRKCTICGTIVYVPFADGLVLTKINAIAIGVMLGISLLDGGSKWLVVALLILGQLVYVFLELQAALVVEYAYVDENGLRNKSPQTFIVLLLASLAVALLIL